jgi:hypothetical protein
MKQNKKAKICFVICFAEKKKLLFYIYAVIVKQNFYKRSSNYYSHTYIRDHRHAAATITSPWHDEPSMSSARSGLGVAALNGFLYAVGGNNGDTRLRSAERLDCAPGGVYQWRTLPPMRQKKKVFHK